MIRDAKMSDLTAIVAIYNASIPARMATADLEAVSVASRQSWFDQHSPRQRPLWVLERDGQIAGWLSFQSFYGRPAYQTTAEVSVYVSLTHRRAGVGRELVREAIERAPSPGLRTLLGFIFEHNNPSLKLFESFGFQRWGNLPCVAELDGVERGLIIVGRRLD